MTIGLPIITAGQSPTADELNAALLVGAAVFRAYRSAVQSIPSGADAAANALVWDEIGLDRFSAGAVSSAAWTCPLAGWWTLTGAVSFAGNAAGSIRDGSWYINDGLQAAGRSRVAGPSGGMPTQSVTVEMRPVAYFLAVGDTVKLVPSQDTGSARDIATGSLRPYIGITYSGPA